MPQQTAENRTKQPIDHLINSLLDKSLAESYISYQENKTLSARPFFLGLRAQMKIERMNIWQTLKNESQKAARFLIG